jgi:exosortase
MPTISVFLIYWQRSRIFSKPRFFWLGGVCAIPAAAALLWLTESPSSFQDVDHGLSITIALIILIWIAGFVTCYGSTAFRTALFPMLLLLLMIPVPTAALDKVILTLQEGSAVTTYALLKMMGVPVLWQHFKFLLPGVEIEIAKECSGIRSSTALFITSMVAGHVFLQSNGRRVAFSLLTIPVVIFKNAVRIVTLSCLGVYVDSGFLHGKLHRYGGLPFSLISIAVLVPVLIAFQKAEVRNVKSVTTTRIEPQLTSLNSALD